MSNNPLLWKIVLIVVVVAGALFSAYPPEDKINLGLDLRGGLHILMQVETGTALKYELDLTTARLGQALKERNISYASIVPTEATATFDLLEKVVEDEDYATGFLQQRALKAGGREFVLFGRNEGGGHRFHGWVDRLLEAEDGDLNALFAGANE